MTLQMTMTLGDLIVAGTMVIAVTGAYYAVKNNVLALTITVGGHTVTLGEHAKKLEDHGQKLARLDQKVFNRRHSDNDGNHG